MSKLKKINKPIVAVILVTAIIFSMFSQLFVPMIAMAATVEKTKLSIRTSSKYEYMNNWAYPDENYGFWIGLGAVALGGAISAFVLKIKAKKDEDDQY